MSDRKKDTSSKKTTLKNKKEVAKILDKKGTTIAKKEPTKIKNKTTTKKKSNNRVIKKTPLVEEEKKVLTKENREKVKKETAKKKASKKVTEEKTKLTLPKEWQKKETKKKKPSERTSTFISSTLRDKIFEEVNIEEEKIQKEKKQKKKKNGITIAIVIILVIILGIFIMKYMKLGEKILKIYPEYHVGEKITLKDGSNWYVIEDSLNDKSSIKLLKETQIDINRDGVFDQNDKKKYNSSNTAELNSSDQGSVAYYLENEYKKYLQEHIGKVEKVSLMSSKEFVKAREKMGYGYEWYEGNWLANNSLGSWWIESVQNEKVYAVSNIGSYKLYYASAENYIRPVITIEKEWIEKKS